MTKLCFVGAALAALSGFGQVDWYAVDPLSEVRYMPDKAPANGEKGGVVRMIAAKGEYEPGSFVLVADKDLGKVQLEVSDLKTADGKVFPKGNIDIKNVKVWYQNGNAWISYFSDRKLYLCPELLLNDEDLELLRHHRRQPPPGCVRQVGRRCHRRSVLCRDLPQGPAAGDGGLRRARKA